MKRFGLGIILVSALTLMFTMVARPAVAAVGDIVTVAGGAIRDGGPGIKANVLYPAGVTVDKNGNLYIADTGNNRIRVISADGTIISIVGSGNGGYGGDGGPAGSALLRMPTGVAIDGDGNMYIADQGNHRIRKVSADGTIDTVAGNGTAGYSGDDGPAASAQINTPYGIAVDTAGNVYFADQMNQRIRKITVATGIISTVAGNGEFPTVSSPGINDGGPAINARLWNPAGVAVAANGDIYIADWRNNRIRLVTAADGMIKTIAGTGAEAYSGDGGPATAARIAGPTGVYLSGSNLFIADRLNERIRKISGGIITTVAGTGAGGYAGDNGPATAAKLKHPTGIAVDTSGNYYFTEQGNDTVRKVNSAWIITTVAGGGSGDFAGDGGKATAASLNWPWSIALHNGDMYIADRSNNRIRKISAADGNITTIAGNGTSGFSGDNGPATSAALNTPRGVAVNGAGDVYIADSLNNRIRVVSAATGNISTIAGGDTTVVNFPTALTFDGAGNLYFTDENNNRVRKIDVNGNITTVAGNGTAGYSGDGGAATAAQLSTPTGVAVDADGNLYIADLGNSVIREVSGGKISTVAGNFAAGRGFSGDGGPAINAQLYFPAGVAVGGGNVYIADQYNQRIRRIAGDGTITTVVGNGMWDYAGDSDPATAASLAFPTAMAIDGSGNIFIADRGNKAIREVLATTASVAPGPPTNVVATGGNAQATVTFAAPLTNGGSAITGYSVTSIPAGGVDSNDGSTARSHLVTGLKNGTSYTFTVTATSAAGTSAPSNASNAVTPATIPDAPSLVIASPGNTQAYVKIGEPFNGGSPITGYTVTSNPAGGVDSNAGTPSLVHVVTGLTNFTPYTFTVRATNILGTSPSSPPSNSVTPALTPDPPVNVSAKALVNGALVTFSAPAYNGGNAVNGYGVISNPAGGHDNNAGSMLLTHTITGLKSGTYYTFTVVARNQVGISAPSAPSTRILTPTVPGAPLNVVAKAGIGNALVTFSPPANNGGSAVTAYGVLTNPAGGHDTNAGSTLLTHSIAGLKSGTYYTFTVVAGNKIGIGPQSLPSAKVLIPAVPTPPLNVVAKAGNGRATVTFSPPASNGGLPVTAYGVLTTPAGGFDSNAGSTLLTHTITGLKNGVSYTFKVVAKNGVGLSAPSLASNAVIPATVPGPPLNVVAKAGNARATVAFTAPATNGGLPVTGYTVVSYPAGAVDSNAGSTLLSHTVTGLANGVGYTFRVVAKNAIGAGTPSAYCNRVVPLATLARRGMDAPAAQAGLAERIRSWIVAVKETVAAQLSWQRWTAQREPRHDREWYAGLLPASLTEALLRPGQQRQKHA